MESLHLCYLYTSRWTQKITVKSLPEITTPTPPRQRREHRGVIFFPRCFEVVAKNSPKFLRLPSAGLAAIPRTFVRWRPRV